jgi:hypothetical protein
VAAWYPAAHYPAARPVLALITDVGAVAHKLNCEGGMHEETQKIRDCVEGQKVGEKCASENRVETQARR